MWRTGALIYTVVDRAARALLCRFFGRKHDGHALAFKHRHLLELAELFKVVGKAKKKHLALLLEKDRTSAEEHVGLYLGALFEEALSMLELEVVVVIVGLRSETYLLHNYLGRLGLLLLESLFLLVKELLVVENLAYRRHSLGRNLHEVKLLLLSKTQSLLNGIYAIFDIIADNAYFAGTDTLVYGIWFFFTRSTAEGGRLPPLCGPEG